MTLLPWNSRRTIVSHNLNLEAEPDRRQLDFEVLAGSLSISYAHLRWLFSNQTGTSLHKYFMDLKISRAKQLLENSDQSVKQVAHALGFDDPYYFSRVFKRRAGMAPSLWQGM